MKKIAFLIAFVIVAFTARSQKFVPTIKSGTVLNYSAHIRAFDRTLPATLTITELTAPLKIKWEAGGMGTGTFEVSAKAIQSGTKVGIKQPGYDDVTKLKDDETLIFLSKDTFNELVTNKTFTLNKQTFKVTDGAPAFTIADKEADTFYALSENGKVKLWILNNPDLPLICKIEGGIQGVDLVLNNVL